MSIEAMNWAYQQTTGRSTAKAVLIALANQADSDGKCWPSVDYIAKRVEITTRSVMANITYLQEIGLLERERRGGDGEGRKTNIYRIKMQREPDSRRGGNVNEAHEGQREGDSPKKGGNVKEIHQQREAGSPKQSLNNQLKKNNHLKHSESDFDIWYQNYPVKKAKKKALESWLKIKNPPPLDHLLSVLSNQIRFDRDWQRGYIPHPTTYLNQERWNDEVQQPTTNEPTAAERTLRQAEQYLRDEAGDGEALDEDGCPVRYNLDSSERRH